MHFWKSKGQFAWLLGIFFGVVFLGIGAMHHEFSVIWRKAVMVCMECIGIG